MKKSIPIVFFICLIAPALVGFLSLRAERANIRHEVKLRLMNQTGKEELCLLSFAIDEVDQKVDWKHGNEFEFKNKMYDVVETEFKGDTVYYWCWLDKEETALNKRFNELALRAFNQSPFKNSTETNLNKVYQHLFMPLVTAITTPQTKIINQQTVYEDSHYSLLCSAPPSPPPNL